MADLSKLEQIVNSLSLSVSELKAQNSALGESIKRNEQTLENIRSEVQNQMKAVAVVISKHDNTSDTLKRAFDSIKDLDIKTNKSIAELSVKLDVVRQSMPVIRLASNGVVRAASIVLALVLATVLTVIGIKGFKSW